MQENSLLCKWWIIGDHDRESSARILLVSSYFLWFRKPIKSTGICTRCVARGPIDNYAWLELRRYLQLLGKIHRVHYHRQLCSKLTAHFSRLWLPTKISSTYCLLKSILGMVWETIAHITFRNSGKNNGKTDPPFIYNLDHLSNKL